MYTFSASFQAGCLFGRSSVARNTLLARCSQLLSQSLPYSFLITMDVEDSCVGCPLTHARLARSQDIDAQISDRMILALAAGLSTAGNKRLPGHVFHTVLARICAAAEQAFQLRCVLGAEQSNEELLVLGLVAHICKSALCHQTGAFTVTRCRLPAARRMDFAVSMRLQVRMMFGQEGHDAQLLRLQQLFAQALQDLQERAHVFMHTEGLRLCFEHFYAVLDDCSLTLLGLLHAPRTSTR